LVGGSGHEHSEDIANERNPVYKLDMDIPSIRFLGVNRNIKKHPQPKRKLHALASPHLDTTGAAGQRGEEGRGYQGARGVDADITGLGAETGE
jgi:hypothetical protein